MQGYNNAYLLQKQVDSKFHLFYQIWTELLDFRTHDSYQYRLMNSLSCLAELKTAIELRLDNLSSSDNDIKDCALETVDIIKTDIVMNKHYKEISNRLLNNLGKTIDHDYQKRALKYQAEYAFQQIEPEYLSHTIQELEDSIMAGQPADIITCTQQLVSYCAYIGWSNQALYNHIRALHNSVKNEKAWENFKVRLLESKKEQLVYFSVKIRDRMSKGQHHQDIHTKNIKELENIGIKTKSSDIIIAEHKKVTANGKFEKNTVYMEIPVRAYDPYSASVSAISQISNALNLLSFYNLIEPWNIRDISWGVFNQDNSQLKWIRASEVFETYYNGIGTHITSLMISDAIRSAQALLCRLPTSCQFRCRLSSLPAPVSSDLPVALHRHSALFQIHPF